MVLATSAGSPERKENDLILPLGRLAALLDHEDFFDHNSKVCASPHRENAWAGLPVFDPLMRERVVILRDLFRRRALPELKDYGFQLDPRAADADNPVLALRKRNRLYCERLNHTPILPRPAYTARGPR